MNQSFWIAEACSRCDGKKLLQMYFGGEPILPLCECPHCGGTGSEPQKAEIQDDGDEE